MSLILGPPLDRANIQLRSLARSPRVFDLLLVVFVAVLAVADWRNIPFARFLHDDGIFLRHAHQGLLTGTLEAFATETTAGLPLGGMTSLLILPAFWLFGPSAEAAAGVMVANNAVTLLLMYAVCCTSMSRFAALAASVLYTVQLDVTLRTWELGFLPPAILAALLALRRLEQGGHPFNYVLLTLALGFATHAHHVGTIVAIAVVLVLVSRRDPLPTPTPPVLFALVVVAAAFGVHLKVFLDLAPVLSLFALLGLAGVVAHRGVRVTTALRVALIGGPVVIWIAVSLLTPLGSNLITPAEVWVKQARGLVDPRLYADQPDAGVLRLVQVLSFVALLLHASIHTARKGLPEASRLVIVFVIAVLAWSGVANIAFMREHWESYPIHWVSPIFPALALGVGVCLDAVLGQTRSWLGRFGWLAPMTASLLVCAVGMGVLRARLSFKDSSQSISSVQAIIDSISAVDAQPEILSEIEYPDRGKAALRFIWETTPKVPDVRDEPYYFYLLREKDARRERYKEIFSVPDLVRLPAHPAYELYVSRTKVFIPERQFDRFSEGDALRLGIYRAPL
jgi:hypothetical protein